MDIDFAADSGEKAEPAFQSGLNRSMTLKLSKSFASVNKAGLADGGERQDIVPLSKEQALFNLISSVVGAGIMALPKTVSRIGWIPGLSLLCLVTVVSAVSCNLVHMAMLMNPKSLCAEDLALSSFGPAMRRLVLLLNNGDLFATCVILLVGGGDALSIIVGTEFQTWCILGVGVVVGLLSLPKDLSGLSRAAFAGVVTLFMFVVVYLADGIIKLTSDPSSDQTLANLDLSRLAGAASIIGFSYSCAILMPSMHAEMAEVKELPWVINVGHGIVFAIYGSMAVIAYAAYGEEGLDVKPEISSLRQLPWAANFCAGCILVTIGVGYPLFMNPMVVFIEAMFKSDNPSRELPTRLLVRISMVAGTMIAALTIPYFYEIVLLTGAISANFMCVILPASYYLKSVQNEKEAGKTPPPIGGLLGAAIVVALMQGTIVMIVGVYYGVIDLMDAIEAGHGMFY